MTALLRGVDNRGFMVGVAYYILSRCLIHIHGQESLLGSAVGSDLKGKISIGIYAAAILLSFTNRWLGFGLYWAVALMWLISDRRIERVIGDERPGSSASACPWRIRK